MALDRADRGRRQRSLTQEADGVSREGVGHTRTRDALVRAIGHTGAQGRDLALSRARGLRLGHIQKAGHVLLDNAEGVVADAQGLLHDRVPLGVVRVGLLHQGVAQEGEEVGAQGQRDAQVQVGVAEDAVDLHGVVPVVALGLTVLVDVVDSGPEVALPAVGLEETILVVLLQLVVTALGGGHSGRATLQLLQTLPVVDGVPREQLHRERGGLRLLELGQDGLLAVAQLGQDLGLQEVGVGRHELLLLSLLLLLEKLDQLSLARRGQLRQEAVGLQALEENRVGGGEVEREIGHGNGLEEGGSVPRDTLSFAFKFTHPEWVLEALGKDKKKFFSFVLGFLFFFFWFGVSWFFLFVCGQSPLGRTCRQK